MRIYLLRPISLLIGLLMAVAPAWSQVSSGAAPAATDETMSTPPTVGLGGNSMATGSELERSNYLRTGIAFQGAYDDNILNTDPSVGDASYTLSPFIELDIQRARLKWEMNYAPGFTFYQKYNSYNQSNHGFATNMQYRLSPHLTMSLQGSAAKSSVIYGQFASVGGEVPIPTQNPSVAIISPITDTLTDGAGGQLTYQFARNSMIGASGNYSELRYLNDSQTPGLFDSSQRGGEVFYSHRISGRHYIGVTYTFQDLLTHPIEAETQVHGATFFYTIYWGPRLSLSLFGGAQHSDTSGGGFIPARMWSPTAGGTLSWQGIHTALSLSASRQIVQGGGLAGAIQSYSASLALRHQFTKNWKSAISGGYFDSNVIGSNPLYSTGGHSITGTASLERTLGAHWTAGFGYSRINQTYSNIAAVSSNPNRNRGWVSVSYNFVKPLGR